MSEFPANTARCAQCGSALPDALGSLCPRCLMAQIVAPTVVEAVTVALPPFAPEEIAPHFPQLEINECLGRGGMGVVYKARQKSLNRTVALKLLAPERSGDKGFAERFAREAQALAALGHPNIVAVHDFGEAGGFYYLLMEYVDGVNLRRLLQTRRLTPQEAVSPTPRAVLSWKPSLRAEEAATQAVLSAITKRLRLRLPLFALKLPNGTLAFEKTRQRVTLFRASPPAA